MRKYLTILLAAAFIVGAAVGPASAACGSTTTTTVLGLVKIAGAKNWWECVDDNSDTLDAQVDNPLDSGTAESGAATTLTDTDKDWATNVWANEAVKVTGGTGSGQVRVISSNTATVLTISSSWTTNPDATSTYSLVKRNTPAQAKVGTFTRDTTLASGTQAVTGVGFQPAAAFFLSWAASAEISWGFDDGTTGFLLASKPTSWEFFTPGAGESIYDIEVHGVDVYSGHVSSFDADGFTITWTKTGSPTGTLYVRYIALR